MDLWKRCVYRINELINTDFGHIAFQAVSVACATGLSIPESAITFVEETTFLEYAESHPQRSTIPVSRQHFKPSMLVDLEAGRPMEVEGIIGEVVRKGRKAGVPLPR